MRHTLLTALLLAATSLSAQTGVTAPKGFNTRPGDFYTFYFGMLADGQFHFGEGSLKGTQAVIGRVSYRLDVGRNYGAAGAMGRSWTNVKMTLGYTDVDKMTATWSTNFLTTNNGAPGNPTLVYDAKASWPTVTGTVSKAAFGQHVNFPLKTVWVYQGRNHDMLFDYQFRGGKLANNGTWGSRSRSVYYLDGTQSGSFVSVKGDQVPANRSCNDSAQTHISPAQTNLSISAYGDNHATTSLRGKASFTLQSLYTAPSAPVIQALGFAGTATGVNIGAACNSFHMGAGFVPLFNIAGSGNASASLAPPPTPYSETLAGLTLWAQSAWTDSKTNRFSLTTASSMMLPAKPGVLRKRMVYQLGFAATGFLSNSATTQSLPLLSQK